MIRILLIVLVLLGSVWLGVQLNHDPGYVLLALNHWTLETTLWFAILILALVFFLLHCLLLILAGISKSPSAFRRWQARRRAQKAQAKTQRGLIEFSEGYWAQAKNNLIKALPDSDSPLLNYLTAARAAQEMGDSKLRDDYLREAQQSMPDAKIAVELTQAQLQLANKQWEQALATLRHLQDLAPHHPYVLKLLMHLYREVKDWPQLIALLPELKKYHVLSAAGFEKLRHEAYKEALLELKRSNNTQAMLKLVDNLPKELTYDPELMVIYCGFLLQQNKDDKAEPILRQALKKEFNNQLIAIYGRLKINDKPLAFAESLVKKQPESSELYLCLGRLSMNDNLWGKAKGYFEKSISLKPSSEAYAELGRLLDKLGDQSGACEAYRQGLWLMLNQQSKL
ncbi:heme biosynthesis HemY N-terminal domain-containing protein [Legionella jordanis]|uniref:Protoporphyrinogen oxidase n=1 Tax=Legionella jordanis TaxID=456 RepID=A0A0W0VBT5_9GAMM|nr:heme biosynthesis HemY N-terminal domain-containing protein [Legionella jordanis]KTD17569.1 protoporphyrinogen oxidase [Legionella jordanis]RMX05095.1 protoporphyrinogen oxidase [Legionella jordanis]RMX17351.1 protoporphyrinogen oxidase [Legionella jordanis]VEH13538.1 HemY protein [Legionella jordanis]HAT8714454.1 protoporphyrinogen oxidase [Legionella jordanis]